MGCTASTESHPSQPTPSPVMNKSAATSTKAAPSQSQQRPPQQQRTTVTKAGDNDDGGIGISSTLKQNTTNISRVRIVYDGLILTSTFCGLTFYLLFFYRLFCCFSIYIFLGCIKSGIIQFKW